MVWLRCPGNPISWNHAIRLDKSISVAGKTDFNLTQLITTLVSSFDLYDMSFSLPMCVLNNINQIISVSFRIGLLHSITSESTRSLVWNPHYYSWGTVRSPTRNQNQYSTGNPLPARERSFGEITRRQNNIYCRRDGGRTSQKKEKMEVPRFTLTTLTHENAFRRNSFGITAFLLLSPQPFLRTGWLHLFASSRVFPVQIYWANCDSALTSAMMKLNDSLRSWRISGVR